MQVGRTYLFHTGNPSDVRCGICLAYSPSNKYVNLGGQWFHVSQAALVEDITPPPTLAEIPIPLVEAPAPVAETTTVQDPQ